MEFSKSSSILSQRSQFANSAIELDKFLPFERVQNFLNFRKKTATKVL